MKSHLVFSEIILNRMSSVTILVGTLRVEIVAIAATSVWTGQGLNVGFISMSSKRYMYVETNA